LHLRGLIRSGESVPNCRVVIASTMPLAASLAAQVEERVEAPVLEIYGSTETGAIAMRRPARDAGWQPMAGVRLESTIEGTRVWGKHFPSPAVLADHIEQDARGGFALLGRQTDLIKIGGRRASLAGLNQLLQELPGLAEGVFYLPESGQGTDRLVLIHAGEPLDRAATDRWLRERVDPAFLPRAIIRVEHLPRTGPGKIPRSALDDIYRTWLESGRGK
jgi:acyl-coenzyme A synthetase/AMP-(fatty) acid ligase